ncbi:hypothetical protein [Lentilactobacillus kosonis]|uniref:hypothetical protein n=1 Tax=Lentilactobacillus kosonis TaxID=2810561 RepID=UPI000F62328A|nr:hypothetical protein [Lentilactobacillus kosonis]
MNKHIIFYKSLDFWLGLIFSISNLYSVVQDLSNIDFIFYLDLVGLLLGIALIIDSIRIDRKTKKYAE